MTPTKVRALRTRLGASVRRFAAVLGVAKSTVQLWEDCGVDGLQKTFLRLIDEHPQVWTWLNSTRRRSRL